MKTGAPHTPGSDASVRPKPRRFYQAVTVQPAGGGFALELDGRPAKTPAKRALLLPVSGLAEAVASEWRAQGTRIDAEEMPFTRLAHSAIDGVAGRETGVIADMTAYAGRDLLCYRADAPKELSERQAAAWDPILRWMEVRLDVHLAVTQGVMPIEQDAGVMHAFSAAIGKRDAFELAALHVMTTLSGSAFLALACAEGRLTAEEAWRAAHVDEDWQMAHWGEDAEAKARQQRRWRDFLAAAQFLELAARPKPGSA